MISLVIFSALLSGCETAIKRPDAYMFGVNAVDSKLRGYHARDFTDNGTRKSGATVYEIPLNGLEDLNGWTCFDPTSFKRIKIYIFDIRDALEREKRTCLQ